MCLFVSSPEMLQEGIFGVAPFEIEMNQIFTFFNEIFISPTDSSKSEELTKGALLCAAFVVCRFVMEVTVSVSRFSV